MSGFFSGTPDELAAHKARLRSIAEQVADLLNQMDSLGSTVAIGPGLVLTDGGTIRKVGRRFVVQAGR